MTPSSKVALAGWTLGSGCLLIEKSLCCWLLPTLELEGRSVKTSLLAADEDDAPTDHQPKLVEAGGEGAPNSGIGGGEGRAAPSVGGAEVLFQLKLEGAGTKGG